MSLLPFPTHHPNTHTWQDTVAEMAKDIKAKRTGEMSTNAAELYAFINRVRRAARAAAAVPPVRQRGRASRAGTVHAVTACNQAAAAALSTAGTASQLCRLAAAKPATIGAKNFSTFMQGTQFYTPLPLLPQVRAGGEVSNDELVRFASLFNDELTLDNLDRVQLVSMCQLLSIPPFGTDGFLRNRLRSQLASIKQV